MSIYQELLDKLTRALMQRDRQSWTEGMAIPHQLITSDGKLIHETRREVEIGFTDYVGALARLGVARMVRECQSATETEPGRISGEHSTAMFKESGRALPEYLVSWTLHLGHDGNWRVAKANSAMSKDQWHQIPYNDLTQFQREDTDNEVRLRLQLQEFFKELDQTFLHGEFDTWRRAYALPLIVESAEGQKLIDTEAKLKEDFELYRKEFSQHKVTDITRVVRTAEMVGQNLMIATYRAHVLSNEKYVVQPWGGAVTLRRQDGRWHVTKILNALGHKNWDNSSDTPQLKEDIETAMASNVSYIHTPSSRRDTND